MARMPRLPACAWPLVRLYPIILVLVVWEVLVQYGPMQSRLFPPLGRILAEIGYLWTNGDYQYHGLFTVARALSALAVATIVGIGLGLLMARSRTIEALLEPLFSATYPVPRIALYPILIFALGTGNAWRLLLVFMECLYPITMNAYYGAKSVDRTLIWAGQNMGADARCLFWRVVMPASLPYIFTGLRVAGPIALIVTIVTEMIGGNTGLGYLVIIAANSFQPPRVFAAAFAIALLGFALDRMMVFVRQRVLVWERV